MLSKEPEVNKLIKRTALDTQPITVKYNLAEYGRTLQTIIYNSITATTN
jgi:DNA-binding HxlR family transcriptional regulator